MMVPKPRRKSVSKRPEASASFGSRRRPAKAGTARRGSLIEAAHGRRVGRRLDELGVLARFLDDTADRRHESVELLPRLRLRGLDHHRALDDEREVDRRRMEAVVQEPLRDVEGADAGLLLEIAVR